MSAIESRVIPGGGHLYVVQVVPRVVALLYCDRGLLKFVRVEPRKSWSIMASFRLDKYSGTPL